MLLLIQKMLSNFAACTAESNPFGFPAWYQYLPDETVAGKCTPVINNLSDISLVGLAFIDILIRLAAMITIGYVIYGGIRLSMSQGDPERIKQGRGTIINGIIGLVIAIIAASVVRFIGQSFQR